MKHKLDKYFKQNLEAPQVPPPDAWEYIENRLPQPKGKKRVFPFWLKFSGIAATLLLMVSLGYWLGTQNNTLHLDSEFVINPEQESYQQEISNSLPEENTTGASPNHLSPEENNRQAKQLVSLRFSGLNPDHQTYLSVNKYHSDKNRNHSEEPIFFNSSQKNVAALDFENPSNSSFSWNHLNLIPITPLMDAEITTKPNVHPEALLATNHKSEKENKKKKHVDFDRFHFSAFASPLAFNTFVGNSMLADEMSEYHTENSVTLAYGFKAAYSLNPILKLRTGVSVVGLEQITHDVPLAVDIGGRTEPFFNDGVNNVHYTGNVRIDNFSTATSLAEMEVSGRMGYGSIQQQASYMEIPVEVELSLFQTNSIGISATGGGSTWLLSKNKIYVHIDDYTQELGQANNLNKVSFSANAGLKFDLSLTDRVKLNVEPNFRYLINPVNNIEKYNPYTVGVNAGVSISLK